MSDENHPIPIYLCERKYFREHGLSKHNNLINIWGIEEKGNCLMVSQIIKLDYLYYKSNLIWISIMAFVSQYSCLMCSENRNVSSANAERIMIIIISYKYRIVFIW